MADLAVAPVDRAERIDSVDVIRGFALLGILLMNIIVFGLPGSAGGDPTNYGGATGYNLTAWIVNHIWFEGKMRAIFSMLFGAGVILFTARAEKRGAGAQIADLYYRRTLWLILFGVIHAYFIWVGDILYMYGVCGLFLFPFRKFGPRALTIGGLLILAVIPPKAYLEVKDLHEMRDKAGKADAAQKSGKALSDEQKAAQEAWKNKLKELKPPKEELTKEINEHRGSYWTLFKRRAREVVGWQSIFFYRFIFWDVTGMMLLGMGLMKLGVFAAERSYREYALMAAIGYAIGVPVNWWTAERMMRFNFDPIINTETWMAYDLGRLTVALAHVAVVMMICKSPLRWITRPLAAVGQTALSNYLLTSVLCSIYFYGYGFRMFAQLERYQLFFIVFAVWTINLVVSPLWLRYFRFGPVEWLWRSLTRWEKQPMRIVREATPPLAATA